MSSLHCRVAQPQTTPCFEDLAAYLSTLSVLSLLAIVVLALV